MKHVGIIGCGKIAYPVIKTIQEGQVDGWSVRAVLTRNEKKMDNLTVVTDAAVFFGEQFDLIIDAGSVDSLKDYGVRALNKTDLWTVNAAALADEGLYDSLSSAGEQSGHRLRVLSGAIAGLDGVATISTADDASVLVTVEVAAGDERKSLFKGGVREAAKLFPESVNVAMETGLAAVNLNKVEVEVIQPGPGEGRSIGLSAKSRVGQFDLKVSPRVIPDQHIHMVSACIIAALRQYKKVIWVG